MAGLCGWIGTKTEGIDAGDLICKMVENLAKYDGSTNKIVSFGNLNIGIASLYDNAFILNNEKFVVAIYGHPKYEKAGSSISKETLAMSIVDAYEKQGSSFLNQLSGGFALLVYLKNTQKYLIANDKLGVYRIYYAVNNDHLVFSSSLSTFKEYSDNKLTVDHQAIFNYLYFHVIPSPQTIYKEIYSLTPGAYIEKFKDKINTGVYWRVRYEREKEYVPINSLKEEFISLVRTAVDEESHISGNVGCFLSGGTDSSTIAGMLGEVTGLPANSYSIGFDEKGYDESEYARITAKHFKTNHQEYYVTPEDVIDVVSKIPEIYGQPFGNSSAVPTYYCAKMASADGVSKLLGGDGGDELFGGNERYAVQKLFSLYDNIPVGLRKYLIEPTVNAIPFSEKINVIHKAKRYVEQASIPMPDRVENYNYVNTIGINTIFKKEFLTAIDVCQPIKLLKEMYNNSNAYTLVNKMQTLDLKITLADNDLPKVNKMCELAGVTVAYPLLNYDLLEFSLRLPEKYKVRKQKLRYFFKEALKEFLPQEVMTKKKHGFGLPFGKWMVSNKKLNELANESLNGLAKRDIVRKEFILDLRDRKLREHPDYYGGIVWVLMILEIWLQKNGTSK